MENGGVLNGQGPEPTGADGFSDEAMAAELLALSGDSQDSGDAAPEQPAVEPEKTAIDENAVFDIGGEKITLKEYRELRQAQGERMMHADYTRKRQKDAEWERSLEEREQRLLAEEIVSNRAMQKAPAPTDNRADLTPDEIMALDPVAKKAYDAAMEAKREVAAIRNESLQREKYAQGQAMLRTLDKFADGLVSKGMTREDAEAKTAEVAAQVRAENLPYNERGFTHVYNAMRDIDAEVDALAKKKFDEYVAKKTKDAGAGLAGGSSFAPSPPKVDYNKLAWDDPAAFDAEMAKLL